MTEETVDGSGNKTAAEAARGVRILRTAEAVLLDGCTSRFAALFKS
jgi:hypothetical protein